MNEFLCPDCQKPIMSTKKAEKLLQTTTSKTLLSRCGCGVAYEIRSLKQNVLDISTSSGKRSEQSIDENQ
jgi:RNase P subunit RPR2